MCRMKNKKKLLVLCFFLIVSQLCAQVNPKNFTNKARELLFDVQNAIHLEDWQTAYSISDTALQYDSNIADFYYIQALSELNLQAKSHRIIPLLEESLDFQKTWHMYSRESARLFLAKQYSIVKRPQDALVLLDAYPVLNSADALLERIKIYYAIDELEKARETVLNGARLYPYDFRFDELFYAGEIKQMVRNDSIFYSKSNYGDFFNGRVLSFIDKNPRLLLLSVPFHDDSTEIALLLKAYNAQAEKNPLYAIYALDNSLLTEQQAFDYIKPFLNDIRYDTLDYFLHLVQDPLVKEQIAEFFSGYNGTLIFDYDGDFLEEMIVNYDNGRPCYVSYDKNQDGIVDWELYADYGLPTAVNFVPENVVVDYSTWPYVKTITNENPATNKQVFNIVDNTLKIDLVQFDVQNQLKECGTYFYIPTLLNSTQELSLLDIFNASYSIDFYMNDKQHSTTFTLLDGLIKETSYFDGDKLYAFAQFENGKLVSRKVDRDTDGLFEIVEEYDYTDSTERSKKLIDEVVCFEHLADGLYLSKISVDVDKNALYDFSQQYKTDGTVISRWISDTDGSCDVVLIEKDLMQEIQYLNPFTNTMKSIVLHEGIPVLSDGKPVIQDPEFNFFWIGEQFDSSIAEYILTALQKETNVAALIVSDKYWYAEKQRYLRIIAVKNGDMYFGEAFYE